MRYVKIPLPTWQRKSLHAFAVRAHAARTVVGIIAWCGQTRLAQPGKQHTQHLCRVGQSDGGGLLDTSLKWLLSYAVFWDFHYSVPRARKRHWRSWLGIATK